MYVYKNGNYIVLIKNDGTKIRKTKFDEFIPDFAENVDVKLTDKCSIGCQFCYEGSTKEGKHGHVFDYNFINKLHPYTEMALNGNDLDHPDLILFLKHLKRKKVFANITVHQQQFLSNYELIKKLKEAKLISGIGISLQYPSQDFINKVKSLKDTVLHVINGILSEEIIELLKNNDLKLLILGYKDLQRGINYKSKFTEQVTKNQQYLYDALESMLSCFDVVSFDNLALEQLNVKRLLSSEEWNNFYMGDDGKFTFYIDLVKGEFAKNSLSQERFPIEDKSIDEMFNIIKNK